MKCLCVAAEEFFENPSILRIRNHWSPLHIAAEQGNLELCIFITENTDDKNPSGTNASTPLHFAAKKGHLKVCKLIIQSLTDKNPADNFGITPLHYAAQNGHLQVSRLIVERIRDKNPANNMGYTPLHYSAGNGHLNICSYIIQNVQNKNPIAINGVTPLFQAAENGHLEICRLLVANGVSNIQTYIIPNIPNALIPMNTSALQIAASKRHFRICKLLINSQEECFIFCKEILSIPEVFMGTYIQFFWELEWNFSLSLLICRKRCSHNNSNIFFLF